MAMLWTALCLLGILLLNPLLQRMDKPVRLIEGALLLNPLSAVSTVLNLDILRTEWVYTRTVAPEFPFLYPSAVASFAVFFLIGLGALALSAIRLRRAYR